MWVQLLIPRIEDGNNFGVSIQEETVAELRTVEGEAASYLDQISRLISPSLCLYDLLDWLCLFVAHLTIKANHFSLLQDITSQGRSWFLK